MKHATVRRALHFPQQRSAVTVRSATADRRSVVATAGGRLRLAPIHLQWSSTLPVRESTRYPLFYGWVIVFVAAMLGFVGTGFFSYARGVFLPHLTQAYGTGTLNVAWGCSASGVVGALIAPWLGRLLDRISPRRVLLVGIVVVTLGYWLLSLTNALWQFYIVVGLFMGVGMSCMGNFTWHRILVSWFGQRRGLALSLAVPGASVAASPCRSSRPGWWRATAGGRRCSSLV